MSCLNLCAKRRSSEITFNVSDYAVISEVDFRSRTIRLELR